MHKIITFMDQDSWGIHPAIYKEDLLNKFQIDNPEFEIIAIHPIIKMYMDHASSSRSNHGILVHYKTKE